MCKEYLSCNEKSCHEKSLSRKVLSRKVPVTKSLVTKSPCHEKSCHEKSVTKCLVTKSLVTKSLYPQGGDKRILPAGLFSGVCGFVLYISTPPERNTIRGSSPPRRSPLSAHRVYIVRATREDHKFGLCLRLSCK